MVQEDHFSKVLICISPCLHYQFFKNVSVQLQGKLCCQTYVRFKSSRLFNAVIANFFNKSIKNKFNIRLIFLI